MSWEIMNRGFGGYSQYFLAGNDTGDRKIDAKCRVWHNILQEMQFLVTTQIHISTHTHLDHTVPTTHYLCVYCQPLHWG